MEECTTVYRFDNPLTRPFRCVTPRAGHSVGVLSSPLLILAISGKSRIGFGSNCLVHTKSERTQSFGAFAVRIDVVSRFSNPNLV